MASGSKIRAGLAYVEAYLDSTKLEMGLKSAQRRLTRFGSSVGKIGAAVSTVGASGLTALAGATRHFAKAGDDLHKMAGRTGASVEALSELGFAAEQSGKDAGVLEKGFKGMARTLYDAEKGSTTAVEGLADLGVTLGDLRGLAPEDQFTLLADRIGSVEDPTRRAGVAMKVFGNAGRDLLPLFAGGADGMSKLRKEARDFGLTIGTDDANAAAVLTDSLNLLWRVVKRGTFAIGAGLAPMVVDLAKRAATIAAGTVKWIDTNRQLVGTIAKVTAGVFAVGTVITAAGIAIVGVGAVLGAAATVAGVFGSAISALISIVGALLSPVGLLSAAVVGLGVYFVKSSGIAGQALDWIKQKLGGLAKIAGEAFGAIRDALAAGDIQAAAGVMWSGVTLVWQKALANLERLWIKTKTNLLGVWRDVQTGIASAFLKTIGTLHKAWAGFSGFVQKRWAEDQNLIAKGFVDVMAFFDDSIDADGAKQILDDQHAAKVAGIDGAAAKRSAEIEQGLRDQLDTLAQMGAEKDAAALSRLDAELREAGKGVADAQAAFDAAVNAAPKSAAGATGVDAGNPLAGLLDSLSGAMSTTPASAGGGTFSSMAGRMIAGGDSLAKKQLEWLEKIAANTEKSERNTRDGMVYGV